MKKVEFNSNVSKRIYNDYLKRVEKNARILLQDDRADILMEINSHLYEGMQIATDESESDRLLTLIENLGAPEDFLKPILAEKKISEATRTFNPKAVYQALALNFKNGIIYTVFAILYLLLSVFGFIIIAKLVFPSQTGLFYINDQFQYFGFVSDASNMNEILGYWLIPIVAATAVIFYMIITLLFRFLKKK